MYNSRGHLTQNCVQMINMIMSCILVLCSQLVISEKKREKKLQSDCLAVYSYKICSQNLLKLVIVDSLRSCIDMVCPRYSNFSIGITLLHHNGTTVHGWEEIEQGLYCNAHSYDNNVLS